MISRTINVAYISTPRVFAPVGGRRNPERATRGTRKYTYPARPKLRTERARLVEQNLSHYSKHIMTVNFEVIRHDQSH